MVRYRKPLAVLAIAPMLVLGLSACGGSSSGTTSAGQTGPTGGPGGGMGGQNSEQFQKIQECLTAAGITMATPSGGGQRPTDMPSGGASGMPSGAPSDRPSGNPSAMPSGGGNGGGGGGFGNSEMFDDPDTQAALKACGLEVPSQTSTSTSN